MVALLGCEGPDLGFDLSPDWPEAKSITIVPDALVLLDGQRDTLEAIVISIDGSTVTDPFYVVWRSRDTGVATLTRLSGFATEVYGLAPGEASVTAEYRGMMIDTAHVVVN
jgi:hypothetical protein